MGFLHKQGKKSYENFWNRRKVTDVSGTIQQVLLCEHNTRCGFWQRRDEISGQNSQRSFRFDSKRQWIDSLFSTRTNQGAAEL